MYWPFIVAIGILVAILLFALWKLYQLEYFQPQKRKNDELQHRINIQRMQSEYDKLAMEAEAEYSEKRAFLQQSYQSKSEKLQKEHQKLLKEVIEDVNNYRKQQQDNLLSELEEYKKSAVENVKEEVAKEINDVLQKKKERMEALYSHFEEAERKVQDNLADLQSKESAAIAARIREYEEQNKESFYRINISDQDIIEIKELEAILPRLRNPLPLRKAIYDIYYKDAVKDMCNRITNGERVTGIYKITLAATGQCYIGQSVDIANRWQQHCKRGAGIETATSAKLYPEMQKYGIHSFKFEIIEQVPDAKLSEREKYWGEYFGAKIFGYSVKN